MIRKTFGSAAAIIMVLALILVSIAGCSSTSTVTTTTTTTTTTTEIQTPSTTEITDMAGRTVSVQTPVERIVLASSRHLHEFSAVGGADVIDKIVGWGSDLNLYDQDTYLTYEAAFPQITDIPDIGYHYKGTFSVESVVSLEPDVIVFPLWLDGTEGVDEDIAKLEDAGIPVVYIDYYVDPFNHPVDSTTIIGKLLGAEERAKEITDFYQEQVDMVAEKVATLSDDEKVSVYIEVGSKGPEEYGSTYSSAGGLGALVDTAGGLTIADGVIEGSGQISAEYLLTENPDIIVISGSYWTGVETSMRLGYHATEEDSRLLLQAFTERGGWDNLTAVQDGKVYSIFHGFSFRIYNFAGIQALAKWFYPDLFADVDPAANFQEFHEQFMPVEYSGVWIMGLTE